MKELVEAAHQVKRAIYNPGKVPTYHKKIMIRHREEWPSLWKALDRLMKALSVPPKEEDTFFTFEFLQWTEPGIVNIEFGGREYHITRIDPLNERIYAKRLK